MYNHLFAVLMIKKKVWLTALAEKILISKYFNM